MDAALYVDSCHQGGRKKIITAGNLTSAGVI
jgi:hypothetical protein